MSVDCNVFDTEVRQMCVSESLEAIPAIVEAITAGSRSKPTILTRRYSKCDVVAASRLAAKPAVQLILRVFRTGNALALYSGKGKDASSSGLIAISIVLSLGLSDSRTKISGVVTPYSHVKSSRWENDTIARVNA